MKIKKIGYRKISEVEIDKMIKILIDEINKTDGSKSEPIEKLSELLLEHYVGDLGSEFRNKEKEYKRLLNEKRELLKRPEKLTHTEHYEALQIVYYYDEFIKVLQTKILAGLENVKDKLDWDMFTPRKEKLAKDEG